MRLLVTHKFNVKPTNVFLIYQTIDPGKHSASKQIKLGDQSVQYPQYMKLVEMLLVNQSIK